MMVFVHYCWLMMRNLVAVVLLLHQCHRNERIYVNRMVVEISGMWFCHRDSLRMWTRTLSIMLGGNVG